MGRRGMMRRRIGDEAEIKRVEAVVACLMGRMVFDEIHG